MKQKKGIKWWLKVLFPFAAYSCLIYTLILSLNLLGFYSLEKSDPIILFAYVSLIHLIAIPVLAFALIGKAQFYLPFVILNAVWLVGVVVMFVLMYVEVLSADTLRRWKYDPLHHMMLISYAAISAALEVLAIIHMYNIQKLVSEEADA